MKRKLIFIFIILSMIFIPSYQVEAKTLRQLQEELNQLEKDYNENKNKKKLTQSEINTLNSQINAITANIINTKKEISSSEQEIIDNQKEIEAKSKETDELLKFLQISQGGNVYLEYLFEADSYTDFIYRYSVVSQLTGHNNELMDELERLNNELEQKKKELAEKQATLEKQNSEYNSKLVKLNANLSEINRDGATIEEDIRDSRKMINYYKSIGCSLDQSLDACISVQYSTEWRYPIAYGTVSSVYTGRSPRTDWVGEHHGIDLWNSEVYGMPVYAAAEGEVAAATWISGGGNAVYIYHNVNGKKYTSVYMHLSKIASGIRQGVRVTTDTIIGYAGNTGGNYGAHLHFGVAREWNISKYDFEENSINPNSSEVLYFSPGTYGPYFYRK